MPNPASGEEWRFALQLASMPNPVQRRLSIEATREFQDIYQDEFGELLSDDEAQHRGLQLLNFLAILTRPNGDRAKQSR